METSRERVISISLNEAEWQAFVRLHPQPVVWLRERIQESIADRRRRYCGAFGSWRSEYDVRDHTLTPGRFTSFTSILRVRFSGSGFVDE